MRICIFGAGAVGGNFGARLARAGVDVTMIARGPHLEAMQARGLTVLAGEERIHVRPFATDDPRRAGPQDAVIVTLKAPALPGAVDAMAPLLGPDTAVVFATNGVPWWYFHGHAGAGGGRRLPRLDPQGILWDRLPIARAVGSVVYSANEIIQPGTVANKSPTRNRLLLGEPDGSRTARVEAISKAFAGTGVDAPIFDDIRAQVWIKLMGNLAWNPMCAVTGLSIPEIASDPALRPIAFGILKEGQQVAEAMGLTLDTDAETRLNNIQKPGPGGGHKPSMLQDFELKRPTELDAIVLAVQDFARELGIATPNLDAVAALSVGRAKALGIY